MCEQVTAALEACRSQLLDQGDVLFLALGRVREVCGEEGVVGIDAIDCGGGATGTARIHTDDVEPVEQIIGEHRWRSLDEKLGIESGTARVDEH